MNEARYFYRRLAAKDARYKTLVRQKIWKRATAELTEWMYCASAFVSATRSTYFYLKVATKGKPNDKAWLVIQERLPIHEIGKHLRDFMLHEATPNTGYKVDLPPPRRGESKGDWVFRGLMMEPLNPVIAISVPETLPHLTTAALALTSQYRDDATALCTAILVAVERLVAEADERQLLTSDPIGPAVSTRRV